VQKVQTIVLDKTGTITEGKASVTDVVAVNENEENLVLQRAASLESKSEHPFGRAIVEYAEGRELNFANVESFDAEPGYGLSGIIQGDAVLIGNDGIMEKSSIGLSVAGETSSRLAREGKTPVFVSINGALAAVVGIADTIKPTSREAILRLKAMGFRVVMITGDNPHTANAIGEQAGVDAVIAGVKPHEKAEHIRRLQAEGNCIAMVGDGVNDAPALAQADISIAMGSGTDVAIESAQITLMHGDLLGVVEAVNLSRHTMLTIKQNLFWAFIYNLIGIPVAAFGLLNPMVAAGAMALSSVSVVSNSLRLRRFKFS
jgi:Cu+-exporting ATPase